MTTLDDATLLHQRLHGIVEQYALLVQKNQPATHLLLNLKRQMPSLAGMLKGQFGLISDLVTTLSMQMTRGSSEQMRVRQMREGMAKIRIELESAVALTIAKHEIRESRAVKQPEELP